MPQLISILTPTHNRAQQRWDMGTGWKISEYIIRFKKSFITATFMTLIYSHAIITTPDNRFIMQSRGYNPGITNPGGISLFGGGLEGDETPLECMKREILEEIELEVADSELLWVSHGTAPDKTTPAERYHYLIHNVDPEKLVLHEGDAICVMTFEEIQNHPKVPGGIKSKFLEYREKLMR